MERVEDLHAVLSKCESPCRGADLGQLYGNCVVFLSSHIHSESFLWVSLQSCGADVQQPAFF